jgi:hypothetical protein
MFNAARIAGICFGFPLLLGYLWFLKYHGFIETAYFASALLAVWGVPCIPRRYFSSTNIKYLVRIVCCLAVITTLPMIYKDITLINGADFPAVGLRSIIIIIEAIYFAETFRAPATNQ